MNKHLVNRQILDFEFLNDHTSNGQIGRIKTFYNAVFLPALESIFDDLVLPNETVRLPKLDIDLGNLPHLGQLTDAEQRQHIAEKMRPMITEIVEKARKQQAQKGSNKNVFLPDLTTQNTDNASQNDLDVWLFYIEQGVLPWFARQKNFDVNGVFEKFVQKTPAILRGRIETVLTISAVARQRVIQQLTVQNQKKLVALWTSHWTQAAVDILERWVLIFEKKAFQSRFWVFEQMLTTLVQHKEATIEVVLLAQITVLKAKMSPKTWVKFVQETDFDPFFSKADIEEWVVKTTEKVKIDVINKDKTTDEVPPQYKVSNAGLCLLRPFLKPFLQHILVCGEEDFKQLKTRIKSAQWLHILVTGQAETPEQDLSLCKILCDVPLNQPIPLRLRVTKKQKAAIAELLETVIAYWTILNNTTSEGFRQTFLLRDGQIWSNTATGEWRLRVERRGTDILLDTLPWGFATQTTLFEQKIGTVEW